MPTAKSSPLIPMMLVTALLSRFKSKSVLPVITALVATGGPPCATAETIRVAVWPAAIMPASKTTSLLVTLLLPCDGLAFQQFDVARNRVGHHHVSC